MERVYTICMVVGIAIPLCSLVLGSILDFFDGLFDGLSEALEGFDLDISFELGDIEICLIPISLQSICAGVLLFGTVGRLTYNGENLLFANIVAGISGYLAAMAIQTLIHRLKKVKNEPLRKEQLLLRDAKVVSTILAGGYGSVSIQKDDGTTLSYPARAADRADTIKQDTPVYILQFDNNVAIVKRAASTGQVLELPL